MVSRLALTVSLMVGCIWCLALATQADTTQSEPRYPAFKPVAPVESLMHGQGIFFKEISQQLAKPANAERNHEIAEAVEVLAELANVNRYNKDRKDYQTWATELRDTALAMAAEAKKSNADNGRMKELHQKMKATCGACHDVYQ